MERSDRRSAGKAERSHDGRASEHAPAPGRRTLTQALGSEEARAPVQRITSVERTNALVGEGAQRIATAGVTGSGGPLPHLDRIQRLFGPVHDVSGISAHVGGPAAVVAGQLGARAYATGTSVAFGESPDLHTAAHEAAHVVQQRSGVQLKGGVGEVGDAYEQHADAVADRVVRDESAADLLGAGPAGHEGAKGATGATAVQRAPLRGVAADAAQVIRELDAAITEGQWEVVRKRVYPREAAVARKRANQRRAGKIPDLAGLGTVTSLDAIARAIKALQGAWSTKDATQRGQAMIDAANTALVAANVPKYLGHRIVDMVPLGAFSRSDWKLFIRKATVEAVSLTSDEAGEVATLVAHESRHAEQHFLQARYLAATGKLAPDIHTAADVPFEVADEAVKRKLGAADPRFAEAKRMNQAFGADGASNQAISDNVGTVGNELDLRRAAAVAARTALQASATAATVADGRKTCADLKTQTVAIEQAYLAYRAIPFEADAHEVGDSESEAFVRLS